MPRALHKGNMLELFCTDLWNPFGEKLKNIAKLINSKVLEAMAYNFHGDLPKEKIWAFNLLGIRFRTACRMAVRNSMYELNKELIRYGKAFAHSVNKIPKKDHNVFIGYSIASLETIEKEKSWGNIAIVNQLEPGKIENNLVSEEHQNWPEWSRGPEDTFIEEYYQRLEAEWLAADMIIVDSNFSKSTLMAQGVAEEKILVVPLPLPWDEILTINKDHFFNGGFLNVLWVGTVSLRKGIPYPTRTSRNQTGK